MRSQRRHEATCYYHIFFQGFGAIVAAFTLRLFFLNRSVFPALSLPLV
jgi:hypothetical protein